MPVRDSATELYPQPLDLRHPHPLHGQPSMDLLGWAWQPSCLHFSWFQIQGFPPASPAALGSAQEVPEANLTNLSSYSHWPTSVCLIVDYLSPSPSLKGHSGLKAELPRKELWDMLLVWGLPCLLSWLTFGFHGGAPKGRLRMARTLTTDSCLPLCP